MSDYVRSSSTFFGDKDALASGNSNKIIKGSEFDTEFNAIATAVNTKYDSADRGAASGIAPLDGSSEVPAANLNIASATEAATLTGSTLISAGVFQDAYDAAIANGTGLVADVDALTDPGADRIMFWDDATPNALAWLTVNTGLAINTTNLDLDISGLTSFGTELPTTSDGFLIDDGGTMKRVGINDAALIVNAVGGTTDTLAAADMNTYIRYTSASAVTVTLNTSTGKVGNWVLIEQAGAGTVSLAGTATLTGALGTTGPNGQYAVIMLVQHTADNWTVFGNAA